MSLPEKPCPLCVREGRSVPNSRTPGQGYCHEHRREYQARYQQKRKEARSLMQRMDPERLYLQLNDDQRQSIAELWVASGRADMDALMDAMGNEYPYHQDEPDPASIVAEARQRIADQRAEAKARLAAEAEARGRANLKAWGLADSLEDQ